MLTIGHAYQVVGLLDLDVVIGPPASITIGGTTIPVPLPSFSFNILIRGGYMKTFNGQAKNGSWAPSGALPSTLNTQFLSSGMREHSTLCLTSVLLNLSKASWGELK